MQINQINWNSWKVSWFKQITSKVKLHQFRCRYKPWTEGLKPPFCCVICRTLNLRCPLLRPRTITAQRKLSCNSHAFGFTFQNTKTVTCRPVSLQDTNNSVTNAIYKVGYLSKVNLGLYVLKFSSKLTTYMPLKYYWERAHRNKWMGSMKQGKNICKK